MSDEMQEIISEFITEAEESLDNIEPLFLELEQNGEDKDLLNNIFRSMHTIKGAAGFLGFQPVVDVAHSSENIMKKLRDGEISLSKNLIDVILKAVDMLRVLLGHIKSGDGVEEDVSHLVQELGDALRKADTNPGDAETIIAEEQTGPESTVQAGAQTDDSCEEKIESDDEAEREAGVSGDVSEESVQKTDETADTPKEVAKKAKETAQNLRVDVERIDKVMDLAGEVVLVRNRLLNISSYFDQRYSSDPQAEALTETVSFLDRVTSDLQLAVMKMRMQPIKKVLSKFPRLVRDMSSSVNKDVELSIHGEGTEVDKTVIENIGDPLTHILRNSIDHGLESTDERIAMGKTPKGSIAINIFQRGNHIIIEITDDGKGIDVDKLKEKAVSKGILSPEDAEKMSDEAATEIIFMPGFSTKDVSTELSGRGVGMDVVKTNISLLNGYVEVHTEKNTGTTFRICIPLTLAIIQALMVEVSGSKYAIPLSPIEETLKVSDSDIENVSGQEVVVIRDKVCPLIELDDLLGLGNITHDENEAGHKYIVVIALGDKKFCIAVDKLLGQEEVVIKTLDGLDTSSLYVLGATITGDGRVVFILDVTSMSRNMLDLAKV